MLRYRLAPAWLFGLRLWHRFYPEATPGFRILLFHDIPPDQIETFRWFVEGVAQSRRILTPEEAENWIGGTAPLPMEGGMSNSLPPVLFSFDDGFVSNLTMAKDVLGPLGVKALFFVAPGLIDCPYDEQKARIVRGIFDDRLAPEDLPEGLRLMTWDEIGELNAGGHSIGSHGMTHRRLSRLAGEELEWEITEAGARLKSELGCIPPWYAYAFGDISSISRSAMEIIGGCHPYCRSGIRGANSVGTRPRALLADAIDLKAPPAYWQLILEGGLDALYAELRERLEDIATDRSNSSQ